LYDFFQKELSLKNPELRDRQRQFVNGYYASFEALRKSSEEELTGLEEEQNLKILRTILIFQLSQLSANIENLQFGLYCINSSEKKQLKAELDSLVKKGVLFFRKQSKTYELAVTTGEDPSDLIDRFVSDLSHHPDDITKAFIEEATGKQNTTFSDAKQYNLRFGEDKRFKTRFIQAKDLGSKIFEELNKEYLQTKNNPGNSYEGTLVYALCENDYDLTQARNSISSLKYNNIAVAVPHSAQPFTDLLTKVKACRYYLSPDYPENLSAQTESRLRDIFEDQIDGYLPQLKRIFRNIEEGSGACWYKEDGKILIDKPKQSYKPADMLCDELFTKRCRIKHPDLNYCHDDKWKTGKNSALKQAVRILLENDKVFIDNGNPDNHGEKRYLEKVLLKGGGALKKISSEGTIVYFSCETEPDNISDDYPILKILLSELKELTPGTSFSVGSFLDKVKSGPYGCGGTTLILILALVLKAYGERLIAYKDSTCMIESPIRSYEDLAAIVSDPAAKLVFKVRKITDIQSSLVDQIAIVLDALPLMHGETRTLNSTFITLHEWWKKLPLVAKNISIYDTYLTQRLNKLKVLLNDLDHSSDSFEFILSRLPEIYGIERDTSLSSEKVDSFIKNFKLDITTLNSGLTKAINLQSEELCKLFGTKGDIVVCEHTIRQWYAGVSSAQRETSKYTDEGAQQLLNRLSDTNANFYNAIMKLLPHDFGFGIIENWTSTHFKDYAARFNQAKVEIDKTKKEVYKPDIEDGSMEVKYKDEKYVAIPKGAAGIIYTTDGTNPRTSENALKTSEPIELVKLLENQPNIKINLRAFDNEGNFSEAVLVELINSEHKYDPKVDIDLFGNQELIIKCPEDLSSFKSVLKSIIRFGVKKKFVNKEDNQELIKLVNDTLQENGE
ncbi:MAG: chitobiase/beta-hexosaminidase C-terminal domain-containing protein, partial [Spirochaetaceae bacterium]|nr:chitobiase/beta-hexosaminidase C-terminal domain-containing protein [Spirochaetaceae bacterium]